MRIIWEKKLQPIRKIEIRQDTLPYLIKITTIQPSNKNKITLIFNVHNHPLCIKIF